MADIYHRIQPKQEPNQQGSTRNQPNAFNRFCIEIGRTLEQISATHNSRRTHSNEQKRLLAYGRKALATGVLTAGLLGAGLTYAIQEGIENGHFTRSEPAPREQAPTYFPDTRDIGREFLQAYRQ